MKYFASVGYQGDGDIYNLKKNDSFDPGIVINVITGGRILTLI